MRRSSLPLILLAASLSACGDPTGASGGLEITLDGSPAAHAYLDHRFGADGSNIYYHTCDDVPVTATALGGSQGDVATWGAARLTLWGLETNAKLADERFAASQVGGWWGGPTVTAGIIRRMFWHVRAKEGVRADIELEYTVTEAGSRDTVDRVAEFSFVCEYKPK